MSILSLLGIDEKETEILALKAELVNVLRENSRLNGVVVDLLTQRDALLKRKS